MNAPVDHTGKVFGRLTVLSRLAVPGERTEYKCQCACGSTVVVKSNSLATGNTTSCGCYGIERNRESKTRHGAAYTPEYIAWKNMWRRTTYTKHKQYAQYKDRKPPESWRSFEVFLAEVGPRPSAAHSLDRTKNSLPYGPGNVRWATRVEQNNNRGNKS